MTKLPALTVDGYTYISNDPTYTSEQMLANYIAEPNNTIVNLKTVKQHYVFRVLKPIKI
jgi:hypothetical protein